MNTLIDIIPNQDILIRFIIIVLASVYGLFAIILLLQVRVLDRVIRQVHFSRVFRFLAFLNFVFSAILIVILLLSL